MTIADLNPGRRTGPKLAAYLPGLLGLLIGTPVLATDWQEIGTDDASNRYTWDADRVIREGSLVKVQVRTEYASPRQGRGEQPVFAVVDRLQLRCDDGSFALESRTEVLADGEEVPTIAASREELAFRAVVPGSMSATILARICGPATRP